MSSDVLKITERMREQIDNLAHITGKPQETVSREVVETGLKNYQTTPTEAKCVIVILQRGGFPIQGVDQMIFTAAAALFQPHASKKNTLFDAVVAAISKIEHEWSLSM